VTGIQIISTGKKRRKGSGKKEKETEKKKFGHTVIQACSQ